jgi:hypothetical protein
MRVNPFNTVVENDGLGRIRIHWIAMILRIILFILVIFCGSLIKNGDIVGTLTQIGKKVAWSHQHVAGLALDAPIEFSRNGSPPDETASNGYTTDHFTGKALGLTIHIKHQRTLVITLVPSQVFSRENENLIALQKRLVGKSERSSTPITKVSNAIAQRFYYYTDTDHGILCAEGLFICGKHDSWQIIILYQGAIFSGRSDASERILDSVTLETPELP